MKMNYLKISMLLLVGTMVACSDDDENAKPNKPEFPTEFSDLTPEQNKENLEANGIEFVNSITTLKNTVGVQGMIALGGHIDGSAGLDNLPGGRKASNHGVGVARLFAAFGKNNATASQTLSALRVTEDDFVSFEDEFNSSVGVYTYNKANDTWTYQNTGDKITFKFPSTETGTVNNAEFSVFGYKGVEIQSNLGGDDYTGDYPTALKAELIVDGTKRFAYTFAAAYNSGGDPKTVSIDVDFDSYNFSYDLKNTVEEVSVNYSLTEAGKNLISFGAMGKGNFDSGNADNVEDANEVATYAGAYFQIMNIKFSGEIDLNKFVENLGEGDAQAQVDALNESARFVVFYADSKEKIADAEFYKTTHTDTWENCYEIYNDVTEQWEWVCEPYEETYDVVDVRMVFADGTKSDLETYTDEGFNDLTNKLEEFFDSF